MPGSLKSGFKSSLKSGEPITYDPGDSMGSGDWLSCGDGDFNDGGSSNTCTESGADSKSGIDVISSFDMSSWSSLPNGSLFVAKAFRRLFSPVVCPPPRPWRPQWGLLNNKICQTKMINLYICLFPYVEIFIIRCISFVEFIFGRFEKSSAKSTNSQMFEYIFSTNFIWSKNEIRHVI